MNALALIPYLAPMALLGVAVLGKIEPGRDPRRVIAASRVGMTFALLLSVASAGLLAALGPMTSPVVGVGEVGFSVRLDALSVVMFAMVAVVGLVVTRFSWNYLDGEERHGAFLGGLSLTVAMVLLLVTAGNLVHHPPPSRIPSRTMPKKKRTGIRAQRWTKLKIKRCLYSLFNPATYHLNHSTALRNLLLRRYRLRQSMNRRMARSLPMFLSTLPTTR